MSNLWLAFKFLLSASLVAAAGVFVWLLFTHQFQAWALATASVLLFFAAWPWVNHERPNRPLAFVGIVLGLMFAFLGAITASGEVSFPRSCSGRGLVFCQFENLLFAVGGRDLAAVPFLLLSLFVLSVSLRSLVRFHRNGRF